MSNLYSIEVARRNRENLALWRRRWEEYWLMPAHERTAYKLMTGWRLTDE